MVHCQGLSSADWRARKGVRDDRWTLDYGWRKVNELNQSLDNGRKMLQRAQESQYDLQPPPPQKQQQQTKQNQNKQKPQTKKQPSNQKTQSRDK